MSPGSFDFAGIVPAATGEEAVWFGHCREHRLMIQHCAECGHHQFPPRSVCVECLAESPVWVEAIGSGTVFTYTEQHRHPAGISERDPYTLAVIELSEGPRMLSRYVGDEPVRIGAAVEVRWATAATDVEVPVFVAAGEHPNGG